MIWYFLFCLFCLSVSVFEHWDSGKDLTVSFCFVLMFVSLFPVMNICLLMEDIENIFRRRFDGVILKGKKT